MSTEKQVVANRDNSQHSTGPTSDEGKTRAATNSLRHGLTATDLCILPGQEEEFESMQEDLNAEYEPQGSGEILVFHQIIGSAWRELRCDRAEAALLTRTSEPGIDPLLDPKLEGTLRTIYRVRAQAAKEFHKSVAELRALQTEHQYRHCAMPESAGYMHLGLGLANWQNIRNRVKRERSMDASNLAKDWANTAIPIQKPAVPQAIDELLADDETADPLSFYENDKTDPIAASAAA